MFLQPSKCHHSLKKETPIEHKKKSFFKGKYVEHIAIKHPQDGNVRRDDGGMVSWTLGVTALRV